MAGDTIITVVGNLTADPELRFTPSGAAVANFTVASTPRVFDRQTGEWKDGEALFLRCNIWRQAAENVAESLTRGARVIVQGRLKQRSFETKDGETRTVVELEVDEIGPSLRYAAAASAAALRPTIRGAPRLRRAARAVSPTNRRSDASPQPTTPTFPRSTSWRSHQFASRRRRSACSARPRSRGTPS
jgi:single-strand DNA-binding protein